MLLLDKETAFLKAVSFYYISKSLVALSQFEMSYYVGTKSIFTL